MAKKHYIIILMFFFILLGIEFFLYLKIFPLSENIVVIKKDNYFTNNPSVPSPGGIDESNQVNEEKNNFINEEDGVILQVPLKYSLSVPFTSQAPYADWNKTYQEACEEASMIMVDAYYKKEIIDKDIATKKIGDLIAWEKDNMENFEDSNLAEVAEILKEYFHYQNVTVIYDDITADNIKYYLYNKKPVIIPAAGRLLKNKYFRTPGPLYHMLVIVGYDEKNFITNDPGTKNGEGYKYSYDVLLNAIHDFPKEGKDNILNGKKAILVVEN